MLHTIINYRTYLFDQFNIVNYLKLILEANREVFTLLFMEKLEVNRIPFLYIFFKIIK